MISLLPRAEAVPFGAAGRPVYPALELWSYHSREAASAAWIFEDDGMSSAEEWANTTVEVTRDPAHELWRLSVRVAPHGFTPGARPITVRSVGIALRSYATVQIGGAAAVSACPAVAPGTYCASGSAVVMVGGLFGAAADFVIKGAVVRQ